LEKALGLALPQAPKTSVTTGSRSALWLGPDEWLIYDAKADPNGDVAKVKGLFSAVDISHRNTAIQISGPHAADVLNAGCPQDLSLAAFDVGACSRTVFGKVEVVLHRVKPTVFRMEVWRSFSAYAFDYLQDAAKDAG
jgi:sarcosine oxidase, subunit gamma